jgi:(p)ppGpp synthase/HD superfamily hydrolase
MNNSDLRFYAKAIRFCIDAHGEQKRKYTNEPYWHHPVNVSNILIDSGISDIDMVCAAILHDTVEDTDATLRDIQDEFGCRIADLVGWLTDVSKPEDGNRAARKKLDREHTALAPAEAQTVKLADLIDNSGSILKHDPRFAKAYMAEKKLLLEVLTKGAPVLMVRARAIVDGYYESHD